MGKAFHRPEALADVVTHYCPGCTHGIAHRLVAEVINEHVSAKSYVNDLYRKRGRT